MATPTDEHQRPFTAKGAEDATEQVSTQWRNAFIRFSKNTTGPRQKPCPAAPEGITASAAKRIMPYKGIFSQLQSLPYYYQ